MIKKLWWSLVPRRISPGIFQSFLILLPLLPLRAAEDQSSVSFDNKSGRPAVVVLVGPRRQTVAVPDGKTAQTTAAPGTYHILVRYGPEGGPFTYTRGESFTVEESATRYSTTTITLHGVVGGNYKTASSSSDEFERGLAEATAAEPSKEAREKFGPAVEAFNRRDFPAVKAMAERGNAEAQFCMGEMYSRGVGVTRDKATAAKWWRKASDQGHVGAQCNLGDMYHTGDGVTRDYAEALRLFAGASDKGDGKAMSNLGGMYREGHGVPTDYKQAVNWYRKAAELGTPEGQVNLGVMYAEGKGIEQDYKEAINWYRKAADQGDGRAQFNLGALYSDGHGVERDYTEAAKWFRKAAEQGVSQAQHNYGVCCYQGLGIPKDVVQAFMWFSLAADQGHTGAKQNCSILAGKMSPEDLSKAKAAKSEWMASHDKK